MAIEALHERDKSSTANAFQTHTHDPTISLPHSDKLASHQLTNFDLLFISYKIFIAVCRTPIDNN